MKKHKKSHQKRKRYRVTTQRKTKVSGRPKPSFSPARRKALKVLIGAAIVVCIGTVVFFSLKHLLPTDQNKLLPAKETLRTEKDIAAIKTEEMQLAERLMSDFGANENSLMIMGNVLHRYGDAVQALSFYEKVLKINPNRPDVYNVMGEFSLSEGNFEEAIGYWRKALALNPGIPKARNDDAFTHSLSALDDLLFVRKPRMQRGCYAPAMTRYGYVKTSREDVPEIPVRLEPLVRFGVRLYSTVNVGSSSATL